MDSATDPKRSRIGNENRAAASVREGLLFVPLKARAEVANAAAAFRRSLTHHAAAPSPRPDFRSALNTLDGWKRRPSNCDTTCSQTRPTSLTASGSSATACISGGRAGVNRPRRLSAPSKARSPT